MLMPWRMRTKELHTFRVVRIVIDTNVLLNAVFTISKHRWLVGQIVRGQLTICYSTEILLEYEEVLCRTFDTQFGAALLLALTTSESSYEVSPYHF